MDCSRRQFLAACLGGTLVLTTMPLLAGCTASRSQTLGHKPLSETLDPLSARILEYAARAPSGHNSQPWEVTLLGPVHWRVGIPPERRLPAVDPWGREALISLGAFVENLVQAAAVEGMVVEVDVRQQDPRCRDILDLRLRAGKKGPDDCLQRMEQRRVVRKGQRPEQLNHGDARWLEGVWPGQLHYFARETTEAQWLAEGTASAMAAQCQREDAMREFAEWVRFGRQSVQTRRDGLTTAGMEIDGLAGWFVDHFYRAENVLDAGFRKQTVDLTARLAGEGAGWLLLRSSGNSPADLIECGRRFQRLFLGLRQRRIACHPMSQMLEEGEGQGALRSFFTAEHHLQMLLRIGYVDSYPDPVSPRRPPGWFVLSNSD